MPPFVGVAVNVTDVPGQMPLAEVAIITEGIGAGITFIVIPALVTVAGLGHTALDIITTVTILPLVRVEEVKVGLLVPTLVPSTFH